MAIDKAIEIRDKLNNMVEELSETDDQDNVVMACCLAVGIEELEKWMYDGTFTPSVMPYTNLMPPKVVKGPRNVNEMEEDALKQIFMKTMIWPESHTIKPQGVMYTPPKNVPLKDPNTGVLNSLKAKVKHHKKIIIKPWSVLNGIGPEKWDIEMLNNFKKGKKLAFLADVEDLTTQNVSMIEIKNYFTRMIKEYPHLWNSHNKKADV